MYPEIYSRMEKERVILCAMMLDPHAAVDTVRIIEPEGGSACFHPHKNAYIYRAIREITRRGEWVNLNSVADQLRKSRTFEHVGAEYLCGLLELAEVSADSENTLSILDCISDIKGSPKESPDPEIEVDALLKSLGVRVRGE